MNKRAAKALRKKAAGNEAKYKELKNEYKEEKRGLSVVYSFFKTVEMEGVFRVWRIDNRGLTQWLKLNPNNTPISEQEYNHFKETYAIQNAGAIH